jgi:hypothetical protein
MEYVPGTTLLHVNVYCVPAKTPDPSDVVPEKNWTCATVPSGSLAVAERVIVAGALNCVPVAGAVIVAVGARLMAAAPPAKSS